MDWFIGSKQGEAKRLVAQLGDVMKRDRAAQDLIRLGADAAPALIAALQTGDGNLLPLYQQILARIPSSTPSLIKTLKTAHPLLRGRAAEVFALSRDRTAVPALLDALHGEYFTVRSRAALALGKIGDPKTIQPLLGALKDDEDEVRIAACLALGMFKEVPQPAANLFVRTNRNLDRWLAEAVYHIEAYGPVLQRDISPVIRKHLRISLPRRPPDPKDRAARKDVDRAQ